MSTLSTEQRTEAREIARQEIASLCGLVLRGTSPDEAKLTRSSERNHADEVSRQTLARIFGEALRDFSDDQTGEPGPAAA